MAIRFKSLPAIGLIVCANSIFADPVADLRYPWDTRPDSCFTGAAPIPSCELKSWPSVNAVFDHLKFLWASEQFALFERALLELSRSPDIYLNGYPHYAAPYFMLQNHASGNTAAKIARWKAAVPNSLFVPIDIAIAEYGAAWRARGGSFSSGVNKDAWALFEQHLEAAETALLGAPKQAQDLPAWHQALLATALLRAKPKSNPTQVFETAVKRWPNFYEMYELMAEHTEPKWGGSWKALEQFAASWSAKDTGDGDTLYFLIYLHLRKELPILGIKVAEMGIDYPHLKRSGLEVIGRYAAIPGYRTLLASYMCAFEDRQGFLELAREIAPRDQTSGDWISGYGFESCMRWAQTPEDGEKNGKAPPKPGSGV